MCFDEKSYKKQTVISLLPFFGRSVIPLIDINGDGRVSVEELAARTDKSMKAFYKDEANTRLKSLDTNNDGKVSWDEYTDSAEKKGGNLLVEMFCDFTGQRFSKGRSLCCARLLIKRAITSKLFRSIAAIPVEQNVSLVGCV